ncbi:hypothetical protein [Actinoplanes sp. NPDC026623]|uniref:hypothetical protein n=1 Tax=Actinoplanes sp. NPDC026623 TaxID=3155610 RepID=UPI0033CD3813
MTRAGRKPPAGRRIGPVRRWVRGNPSDVIDVFVYVVVLNLAIEYVPAVISEGFTLTLLTAVLLKVALELVDVVFGDAVSLGGFVSVTLLVIAFLGARAAVRRLLENDPDRP